MEVGFLTLIKAILNTIVRLLPLGFYSGSAMSALMFQDIRGTILFVGFTFVILCLIYKNFQINNLPAQKYINELIE